MSEDPNKFDKQKKDEKVWFSSIDQFEEKLIVQIKTMTLVMFNFLKNPILGMVTLPDWSFKSLLLCIVLISMTSGVLLGLLSMSFLSILSGILIAPLIAILLMAVSSLLFYYSFQILFKEKVDFRKIVTILIFANVPYYVFQTISVYVPPITLVGLCFTAFLLRIGFLEHFKLPKEKLTKFIAALLSFIILIWIWKKLEAMNFEKHLF